MHELFIPLSMSYDSSISVNIQNKIVEDVLSQRDGKNRLRDCKYLVLHDIFLLMDLPDDHGDGVHRGWSVRHTGSNRKIHFIKSYEYQWQNGSSTPTRLLVYDQWLWLQPEPRHTEASVCKLNQTCESLTVPFVNLRSFKLTLTTNKLSNYKINQSWSHEFTLESYYCPFANGEMICLNESHFVVERYDLLTKTLYVRCQNIAPVGAPTDGLLQSLDHPQHSARFVTFTSQNKTVTSVQVPCKLFCRYSLGYNKLAEPRNEIILVEKKILQFDKPNTLTIPVYGILTILVHQIDNDYALHRLNSNTITIEIDGSVIDDDCCKYVLKDDARDYYRISLADFAHSYTGKMVVRVTASKQTGYALVCYYSRSVDQ